MLQVMQEEYRILSDTFGDIESLRWILNLDILNFNLYRWYTSSHPKGLTIASSRADSTRSGAFRLVAGDSTLNPSWQGAGYLLL